MLTILKVVIGNASDEVTPITYSVLSRRSFVVDVTRGVNTQ